MLLIPEHKTTSQDISPGGRFWTKCELDSQISNYVPGCRSLGFGEPHGVLYDVVRKLALSPYKATPLEERSWTKEKSKQCPACKKKGGIATAPHRVILSKETSGPNCVEGTCVEQYRNGEDDDWHTGDPGMLGVDFTDTRRGIVTAPSRLHADVREQDETLEEFRKRCVTEVGNSPEKYLQRCVIVRLAEEERDAAFNTWQVAQQIRESERLKRWPQNPDACELYNRLCEYHVVCTRKASIDDETLYRTDAAEHAELGAPRKYQLPILSTSSAKAYRACNRKYYFYYVLRRRPLERSHALRFGTLMHIGIEAWWRGGHADLQVCIDAMRAAAGGEEMDEWDLVKAEVLLAAYHVRWKDEPMRVLAVEQEFEAPLLNPETGAASRTWVRGGKLDAVAEVIAMNEESHGNSTANTDHDHHADEAEKQVA